MSHKRRPPKHMSCWPRVSELYTFLMEIREAGTSTLVIDVPMEGTRHETINFVKKALQRSSGLCGVHFHFTVVDYMMITGPAAGAYLRTVIKGTHVPAPALA